MGDEELQARYQRILADAGYGGGSVQELHQFTSGFPSSRNSFDRFAHLPVAAKVAALIRVFSVQVGLCQLEDFSVACLPPHPSAEGQRRAATVLVGDVEVMVPMVDCIRGGLTRVMFFTDSNVEITQVLRERKFQAIPTDIGAGCWMIPVPAGSAFQFMSDPVVIDALRGRVVGIRRRRLAGRREQWHNPWLWRLIKQGVAEPALSPSPARLPSTGGYRGE